jgi:ABC-type transport system involved in cytochrome c biogenesis permease subunit
LRSLPVLDHGRVKPIDTVARETVHFITGCESFGPIKVGDDGLQAISQHMDPLALCLDWAAHPVQWQTEPVLYVPLFDLRAKLNMTKSQQWISARQVLENTEFTTWVLGVEQRRETAEQNHTALSYDDPIEKRLEDAAVELDERLKLFSAATDQSLYFVLPADPAHADQWISIAQILALTDKDAATAAPIKNSWAAVLDAYKRNDDAAFAPAATSLEASITDLAGNSYFDASRIDREVFYNWFKPFRWAWVIYLITIGVLIGALMSWSKPLYIAAMSIFGLAIAFHASAFALRCSITGWAPVTNMYETVVWVAMMAAVFAFILELIYRQRTIAIGGAIVALVATVIADVMPPEWGNAMRNLTPVLRSNYWLIIHVLTIVSSYAAFALAMVLGNIILGQYIYGKANPASIRTNLLFTYRAVQIGVLLVATGTILGGLWADVSWGKFWSWDPKEVWALIILLTYLALLHGRYAGWVKQFGLAAGAVICFSVVLMSWYGVNFVLGAGLHSYGFNTGGQGYVYTGVAIQWVYVFVAWIIHSRRESSGRPPEEDNLPRAFPVTGT